MAVAPDIIGGATASFGGNNMTMSRTIASLIAMSVVFHCGIAFGAAPGQPSPPGSPLSVPQATTTTSSSEVLSADQTSIIKRLWSKYNRLGELALSRSQPDLSLEMFGHALDEAKLLGLSHPAFATTYDGLMKAYAMQGRFDDASQAGLEALALREKTLGKTHPAVGKNLVDIATIYRRQKKTSEADQLLRRASAIQNGTATANSAGKNDSLIGQAKLNLEQGKMDQAAQLYEKVIVADLQKSVAPGEAAGHLEEFAALRWQQGMLSQSAMLLSKALANRERVNPDTNEARATLRNYGRACALTGRLDEGAKAVQRLLQYDRNKLNPSSPDFAFDLCSLGLLKLARGENSAAEMAFDSALDTQEKALPADHPDLADSFSGMARVNLVSGNVAQAEKLFRRALEIKEHARYPDVLKVDDLEGLAKALAVSNASESAQLLQKASNVRQKTGSQIAAK